MKDIILKHTLKNAFEYGGKVNPNVVLGLVLKENPELKSDVPSLRKEIGSIIPQVEVLSPGQIKQKLQQLAPELLQERKEDVQEGPLKPLPNAQQGKVVVRIAPSPSGPLHIGHAYGLSLNYEYAKMYNGKLILRIEDTNPENLYPPAYELIPEDVQWLTEQKDVEVVIQSSHLGTYYDHAEKLVQQGNAYVCTCDADAWKELKNKGIACPCRNFPIAENQTRYAKMFSGYAEGEAVLRLKTDIQDKNPALRDFGIMRIVEHIHPKTGTEHRVWPLMVFSVAIDDHELGITHVLNGKDHTDNAIKEKMIMDCFGWNYPEYKHWGRINFEGFALSTTQTRQAIEQGQYKGWDDIRLPFIRALRRRGYQPAALRKFALDIGLSLNDKTVSREEFWKIINAFNRELIEPTANRYFFIDRPVKITIKGLNRKNAEVPVHPDHSERGKRTFSLSEAFYISQLDLMQLGEGYVHRLMDCCNFVVEKETFRFLSEDYESYKNAEDKGKIIHWLPAKKTIPVTVTMDTGIVIEGIGEEGIKSLRVGDIIQLERRYFARVDAVQGDTVSLWYLHK